LNGQKGGLETSYLYEMKSFEAVKAAVKAPSDYFG
jgi:hypothetical protein